MLIVSFSFHLISRFVRTRNNDNDFVNLNLLARVFCYDLISKLIDNKDNVNAFNENFREFVGFCNIQHKF